MTIRKQVVKAEIITNNYSVFISLDFHLKFSFGTENLPYESIFE